MLPERRRKATFSASPGVSSHASRQLRRRMSSPKAPSLLDALIPLLTLIVLLVLCVYLFGSDATGGPTQIVLILGAAVAALVAVRNGHPWPEIQKAIVAGIGTAMGAIMILLMVRSEEHTSELQSRENLVCRLLLEKKKIEVTQIVPVQD